jgi:hypothetical protein
MFPILEYFVAISIETRPIAFRLKGDIVSMCGEITCYPRVCIFEPSPSDIGVFFVDFECQVWYFLGKADCCYDSIDAGADTDYLLLTRNMEDDFDRTFVVDGMGFQCEWFGGSCHGVYVYVYNRTRETTDEEERGYGGRLGRWALDKVEGVLRCGAPPRGVSLFSMSHAIIPIRTYYRRQNQKRIKSN